MNIYETEKLSDSNNGLCVLFPPFFLLSGLSVDVVDIAPDATSWFGLFCFSARSLFPAEPAPMQTRGRTGGFSYSCRSRVLSNIQKSLVMDQHARANILIPFYHLFPLQAFFSEILGKVRDPICNGAIKRNLWMTVMNGADGDGGKCGARRTVAASQETV